MTRETSSVTSSKALSDAERQTAFLSRDASCDGLFWTGVRTTGIYCRPSCPARKPLPRNLEFFDDVRAALRAGYRACKRCRPDTSGTPVPEWARALLADIEREPLRRRSAADLRARGVEPVRARRWFQQRYGVTFVAYARSRRLALALHGLARGARVDATALSAGYESQSGFRDAFAKLFGAPPSRASTREALYVAQIATPLGPLLAAATRDAICFAEFTDRRALEAQVRTLRRHFALPVVPARNELLRRLTQQLEQYFAGERRAFDLPLAAPGTPFQRRVWDALAAIPYGETRSYAEIAQQAGTPRARRAVGRANGMNRIAILLPCHRVVGADGQLTGYGGGLWRKQRLLELEGSARR
jgi:AraC family transcriptional regulator of adaptative response/methylated-DNA-[protein]-cysteine methyltransferase